MRLPGFSPAGIDVLFSADAGLCNARRTPFSDDSCNLLPWCLVKNGDHEALLWSSLKDHVVNSL